jgi:CubicO group peptidase (beta-lactamase class C family)
VVAGVALVPTRAPAQPGREGDTAIRPELSRGIDSLFARYDRPHVTGGVAGVIHRGRVIHLRGYGAAQREFDVRWTPDTRYRLASITKSLVASALYRLERQGRLRLSDPVRRYLPDFPDFGTPLTLDHLVTMRSGLWQDETLLALASLRGSVTLDDMYALSRRQRALNFPPGSSMAYTDTNFRLLARVMAAVTGRSFWDAMRELVFEPAGMAASLADPSLHQFYDRQAPTYLGPARDTAPPLVNVPFPASGDGSVITTMRDLIRWLQLLRADAERPGSLFQWMIEPFRMGDDSPGIYRRGIAAFAHRGLVGWTHGGFTGTFYAFYPEIDLVVAVFANQLGAASPAELGRAITDLFLESEGRGARGPLSRASLAFGPTTGPVSAADRERLTGTFYDPKAGYVLATAGADGAASAAGVETVRYDFLGADVSVGRADDGAFASPAFARGPRLTIRFAECDGCARPDLMVREAGWPKPRRFVRSGPETRSTQVADYVGHYYLEPFGVYYRVTRSGEGLALEIGAGVQASQVLYLTPLGDDVFRGRSRDPEQFDLFALGSVSLQCVRGAGDRVTGLRFSVDRVRDLELTRVR